MEFQKESNWIWIPSWSCEDKEQPCLILFRKEIEFATKPIKACISISADTRYKLYINEKLVEVGPSKGDYQVWYLDSINVESYLKQGINIISVEVLRYPQEPLKGNHSTFRTSTPGLYFVGEATDADGNEYSFSADGTWKCCKEDGFCIAPEETRFAPLLIHEEVRGNLKTFGWMRESYNDENWETAKPYIKVQIHGAVSPGNLRERTIPFMYRTKRNFLKTINLKKTKHSLDEWNGFIRNEDKIIIAPNSEEIVEFDAGEEMTGYTKLVMTKGKGTKVEVLYSEAYVQNELCGSAQEPLKRNRLDSENGYLHGYTDVYHLSGIGNDNQPEIYEPFWFRTFRFIQLKITTSADELVLHSFDYEETGYPLDVQTQVETSDVTHADIWDISERTLRRCMHETYEDCPFYEQLQYAMDSRQQILYTYAVSADDRLARKCMDDFKRSQRYDGLINCSYPSTFPNIIPGFSIYYILMIYDHMMYFGDKELITYHMPTIDGVLNFFDRNLTEEGYVKKVGGVNMEAPFWSFIDWASEWDSTAGMPTAGLQGSITMESLLYIMGLQHASELALYLNKKEKSEEYLKRAESVKKAVLKFCMGDNGLLQDGPGIDVYSQHCQVFALLTDTVGCDVGRKNLYETICNKEKYAQSTVAMCFYLFRALEKANLYEYTNQYWDIWRNMIQNNCTTCVEAESYARSECHAWGALALYEFPSVILGVRPAEPGYAKVAIKPIVGYLDYASGCVKTPHGMIQVKWTKENENIKLEYELPDGLLIV